MAIIGWRHYADLGVAPLCRSWNGSIWAIINNYIRSKRADTSAAWINSIFLVMNLLILQKVFYWFMKRVCTGMLYGLSKFANKLAGYWRGCVADLLSLVTVTRVPVTS